MRNVVLRNCFDHAGACAIREARVWIDQSLKRRSSYAHTRYMVVDIRGEYSSLGGDRKHLIAFGIARPTEVSHRQNESARCVAAHDVVHGAGVRQEPDPACRRVVNHADVMESAFSSDSPRRHVRHFHHHIDPISTLWDAEELGGEDDGITADFVVGSVAVGTLGSDGCDDVCAQGGGGVDTDIRRPRGISE